MRHMRKVHSIFVCLAGVLFTGFASGILTQRLFELFNRELTGVMLGYAAMMTGSVLIISWGLRSANRRSN